MYEGIENKIEGKIKFTYQAKRDTDVCDEECGEDDDCYTDCVCSNYCIDPQGEDEDICEYYCPRDDTGKVQIYLLTELLMIAFNKQTRLNKVTIIVWFVAIIFLFTNLTVRNICFSY